MKAILHPSDTCHVGDLGESCQLKAERRIMANLSPLSYRLPLRHGSERPGSGRRLPPVATLPVPGRRRSSPVPGSLRNAPSRMNLLIEHSSRPVKQPGYPSSPASWRLTAACPTADLFPSQPAKPPAAIRPRFHRQGLTARSAIVS